jgi:hypothetical protein
MWVFIRVEWETVRSRPGVRRGAFEDEEAAGELEMLVADGYKVSGPSGIYTGAGPS